MLYKLMFRISSFLLAILCITIFLSSPSVAHAGLLEFFFPSLKKETYNPYKTLKAPFSENPEQPQTEPPKDVSPLNMRHRTTTDIADWLADVVPEILSLTAVRFRQDVQDKAIYFDQNGIGNFSAFLTNLEFVKVLDAGQYNVHSIVSDQPILLNEGVVEGRYRWLFEVPVMVTYLDRSAKGYEKFLPVNRFFALTVQVGRTTSANNEHNILIETWDGRIQK